MIEQLTQPAEFIVGHEREILIWTHGIGWALALRRSRISNLLDWVFGRFTEDENSDDQS